MASSEQTDTLEQQNATGVGALLKASRLRIGEDLRDIAAILKIRYVYLEAIEDGRFEELPGTTYTLGFVRAYAEHLGLDSDEVIRRYKSQESGVAPSSQLDFPEPIPEASVPGGAVIFIGVVVAVLAYGAWYVNSSKDGFFTDLIAPLPDRFTKMSGDPKAVEKAEPEKIEPEKADKESVEPETVEPEKAAPEKTVTEMTATEQAAAQPGPVQTQAKAKPTESTQEAPPAESVPETAQQPEPEETPTPATATESAAQPKPEKMAETTPETTSETTTETTPATPPESAEAQAPEKTPEAVSTEDSAPATTSPPAPASPPAPEPSSSSQPAAVTETAATPDPAPVVEPVLAPSVVPIDLIPSAASPVTEAATAATASEPVSANPDAAQIQTASTPPEPSSPTPAAEEDSRIIVRAKTNSWIQVRDDTANELLLTRLLRAGDSYTVPGRSGLMLSTGNAGALEILVDGEAVPSIGAEGVVRRKVLLDAARLKAGTAVNE